MNKPLVVFLTFVFITMLCAGTALAATQLAYDDGTSEVSAVHSDSPTHGEEFDSPYQYKTVRFTPTGTVTIESIQTYWPDTTGNNAGTQHYNVAIYNSAGNRIYGWSGDVNVPDSSSSQNVWLNFNLPSTVTVTGDFYVVVNAPTASSGDEMNLGTDTNVPHNGRSYRAGSCGWIWVGGIGGHWEYRCTFTSTSNQNYMIRATVSSGNNAPVLNSILDSPDPVKSGAPLTVAASATDSDSDPLGVVCDYATAPTTVSQACSNYPQNVASPYTGLNCAMTADSNNAENTIYCRAYDGTAYSNQELTTSTDDNEPPEVAIALGDDASGNDEYDNDGTVYATLSRSDESGITSCKIDWGVGAGFETINPNSLTSLSHVLPDGVHTVLYKCMDNVGWENVTSDTIIVDTTPPSKPVLTVTDSPRDTDNNVVLDWTASTDANGIDKYEIWRSSASPLYASEPDALIATVGGGVITYADNGLKGNTTYTWHITAFDPAQNSADSDPESTRIDSDAPKTHITSPVDGSYTNSPDVTVIADYSNTYDVTCQARVDSGSWGDMSGDGAISGTATYGFTSLADGNHLIEVQCDDGPIGGLTSIDAVHVFVDTHAPNVGITLGDLPLTSTQYDNDGLPWAQLSNSDNAPSSGYTCEINWDGSWHSISKNTHLDARFFATDGWKTVAYRCTDRAGNVGTTSDTILIDRVYPTSTASVTDGTTCNGEWYNSDVEISLDATDPGFSADLQTGSGIERIRYSLTGAPGSFSTYAGPITVSAEGETTVYYYAIDNAGNWEVFHTGLNHFTVKIDKTVPSSAIVTPADTEHFALDSVLFTGTASDALSGVNHTEVKVVKISDGSIVLDWTIADGTSIWSYNWTSTQNLEYRLYSRAIDNACNVESTATVSFTMQDDYNELYYTKDEVNAMLDNVSARLDALNGSINATNAEVAALRTNISFLWIEIQNLYEEDDALWNSITALSSRVDVLEQQVKAIQGDLDVFWRNKDAGLMAVKVYFPYNATSADVYAYDSNGVQLYGPVALLPGPNFEADLNWDVSTWPHDVYTIKVHFLGAIDAYAWRAESFDGILLKWLDERQHGFEFVESGTFETFEQSTPFGRGFVWGFTPNERTMYKVQLVTYDTTNENGNSLTQDLAECQWFQQDYLNQFYNTLSLPATWPVATGAEGVYKVYLIATPCEEGFDAQEFVSNTFSIELDDLAAPWPTYGVNAMSVLPGYDNYAENVFWTNTPIVELTAQLSDGTDWMNDLRCEVWNYKSAGQRQLYESWDFGDFYAPLAPPVLPSTVCSGDIDLADPALKPMRPGSAPQYDIELCAHPVAGQVSCSDIVTFGYDTTAPSINFVYPGAYDNLSGTVTFSVDVTDDGVIRYVLMHLVNKTNGSQMWPSGSPWQMGFNPSSGNYELVLDTTQMPDGYYNISIEAIDFAGNAAYSVLDPPFDNTEPIVQSVAFDGHVGAGFSVSSRVTDNLLGVMSAYAEVWSYTCLDEMPEGTCIATWECTNKEYSEGALLTVPLSLATGDVLDGTWTGSLDGAALPAGVQYEARVYATDAAHNVNTGDNALSTQDGLFSSVSYAISLSLSAETLTLGQELTMDGSVVGSDGEPVAGIVVLAPWASNVPLALGYYSATSTFDAVGAPHTVTATFTPDASCPDSSVSVSKTVFVNAPANVGGGGGGGGGGSASCTANWECTSWSACDGSARTRSCTDTNNCVIGNENSPATSQSCTLPPTTTGGQGGAELSAPQPTTGTVGGEQQSAPEPAPVETPAADANGITGAVTGATGGAGFASLLWLWILLALIVLGVGGYYAYRKFK